MCARRDVLLTRSRRLLPAVSGALLLPAAAFLILLLLLQNAPVQAQTDIIYVDVSASGGDDGSSWADAYLSLQDALADAGSGSRDEIWVAAGVYYPDEGSGQSPDDRASTFQLLDGVEIYGGFAATETLRTERDWQSNVTVLSGDIDQDDTTDGDGVVLNARTDLVGDNAYHVVTGSGVTTSAVLDGFTITAGNAGASGNRDGGGMYNDDGSPTLANVTVSGNRALFNGGGHGGGMYNVNGSSPTLSDVTFSGNYAGTGGGMHNRDNSSPTITGATFAENRSRGDGGGIYNRNDSNPTLTDVTFSGNFADFGGSGGGMHNNFSSPTLTDAIFGNNEADDGGGLGNFADSHPTLTNVTFNDNEARSNGGAIDNSGSSSPTITNAIFNVNEAAQFGGAIHNSLDSDPAITNATFSSNEAERYGGAIYNTQSNPTLTNVAFRGNRADDRGGGLYNFRSDPTLTNATFSGNLADIVSIPGGGGMYNDDSSPTIQNSILWHNQDDSGTGTADASIVDANGSATTISHSLVQAWNPAGTGNLDGTDPNNDPLFVTPVDPADAPTTEGDLRVQFGSPAIEAGDNNADLDGDGSGTKTIADVDSDLDGNDRLRDGDNDGAAIVDLGAYEFISPVLTMSLSPTSVVEDSGQPMTATFTRTKNTLGVISATFDVDGTATLGADYTQTGADSFDATSGSITFNEGAVTSTVQLIPTADLIAEPDETITVSLSASRSYSVTAPITVIGTITDDDSAGVMVAPTGGLTTTEAGGTDTFTVTLQSEPTGTVTMTLSSDDLSEGTVSPTPLTFDATNWQSPQAATVTGVDDDADDGDVAYTIQTAVSSDDPAYDDIAADNVSITNLDDDDAPPPPPTEHLIYLPVVLGPPPGLPDLVVDELSVADGELTVVIANEGETPVVDPFWVDVYIDPHTPPANVNDVWWQVSEEGLVWGITDDALPLEPGEMLTLTIGDVYYAPAESNFSGALPAGTVLYAQVDSAHAGTEHGAVLEAHEAAGGPYDNIVGPLIVPKIVAAQPPDALPERLPATLPPRP